MNSAPLAPGRLPLRPTARSQGLTEPTWVRWLLIGIVVLFLASFLMLPLAVVFHSAFGEGWKVYFAALTDPIAISAIKLTLLATGVSVLFNTVFGVAAAWLITRFRFPGKSLLLSLIDLPFAVSPVIAGMVFVLVFGAQGWAKNAPVAFIWPVIWWGTVVFAGIWLVAGLLRLRRGTPGWLWWTGAVALIAALVGENAPVLAWYHALFPTAESTGPQPGTIAEWLQAGNDLPVIFAPLGITLATMFVTFPFVARELIPVMQSVGQEEEQAALSLGASGWTTFWRVTLPNVKWGLLYGVILCNARAMGEFGAVSVVSGHIRGKTNTMPLHIEILFNEYHFAAAFAVASILALLALVTLVVKTVVEYRMQQIGEEL